MLQPASKFSDASSPSKRSLILRRDMTVSIVATSIAMKGRIYSSGAQVILHFVVMRMDC